MEAGNENGREAQSRRAIELRVSIYNYEKVSLAFFAGNGR
jgi:hypothetical protein